MEIDQFLARRIRELRKSAGLTLEQLAESSGVSRSTISLIERLETSPTAAVLNKLANAFGISLPSLFAGSTPGKAHDPVSRLADQPVWTDPATGYVRRHLTPASMASPMDLVEITFPAGQTVVFDSPLRKANIQQQIWVLEGAMEVSLNDQTWHLAAGDCMATTLGERITFHNPAPGAARYLLALVTAADFPRRPS